MDDRAASIKRKVLARVEAHKSLGVLTGLVNDGKYAVQSEVRTAVDSLVADGLIVEEEGVLRTPDWAAFNRRFVAECRGLVRRRGLALIGRAVEGRFT